MRIILKIVLFRVQLDVVSGSNERNLFTLQRVMLIEILQGQTGDKPKNCILKASLTISPK
jgi:hypothetical protein